MKRMLFSLIVGAILLTALGAQSMTATPLPQATPVPIVNLNCCNRIAPADMVVLDSLELFGSHFATVTTTGEVVYTVPANKWFVLTAVSKNTPDQLSGSTRFEIKRNVGGTIDTVINHVSFQTGNSWGGGGPVGISFPPNSEVIIDPTAGGSNNVNFTMIGYLTTP